MEDFIQTEADKMHYRELADSVRFFKESEEGVSNMCKAMEEMRDKAKEESIVYSLKSIMDGFSVSMERAMDVLKIPAEKREHLAMMINS